MKDFKRFEERKGTREEEKRKMLRLFRIFKNVFTYFECSLNCDGVWSEWTNCGMRTSKRKIAIKNLKKAKTTKGVSK